MSMQDGRVFHVLLERNLDVLKVLLSVDIKMRGTNIFGRQCSRVLVHIFEQSTKCCMCQYDFDIYTSKV